MPQLVRGPPGAQGCVRGLAAAHGSGGGGSSRHNGSVGVSPRGESATGGEQAATGSCSSEPPGCASVRGGEWAAGGCSNEPSAVAPGGDTVGNGGGAADGCSSELSAAAGGEDLTKGEGGAWRGEEGGAASRGAKIGGGGGLVAGVRVGERARRGVLVAVPRAAPQGEVRGLCVGSADPHCLWAQGEVKEPRDKSAATFGVGMLEAASREELRRRPIHHFNEAPKAAWREVPRVPAGPPPRVEALTDVVPKEVVREVLRWTAKLGACLKAAARGNWRLAKSLRPEVQTFELGHRVPGTEPWVWDLRPLQWGGVAVPLWPSGGERPPETDLILSAVREAGAGFADQGIVSEIIHGISDDAPWGGATVLSPPHEGALRHYAQVVLKLEKDAVRGWSSGGWRLPFWPIRANPYSIVEEVRGTKTKYRMVIDLSWPRWLGSEGQPLSVNASMDRSEWPAVSMPRPMQIAEAAAVLASSGGPVELWGLDCEAYYRKVGRQRAEVYRNCLWMRGGFVVDPREQFGDASAAVKCVRMSGLIVSQIHRAIGAVDAMFPPTEEWAVRWRNGRPPTAEGRSQLCFFGMFVDDGAGGSINDKLSESWDGAPVRGIGPDEEGREGVWRGRQLRRAELHFAQAVATLGELGHASEPSKEQPPGRALESLGCVITLGDERVRLSPHKRMRYAEEAERLASGPATCELERVEQITHKLLYVATVYPAGRQWLHCLFRALRGRYRLRRRGEVPVSRRMRVALRRWAAELRKEGHIGVPLASPAAFPRAGESGVVVAYSDASGEHGFGAWAWCGGRQIAYTCERWGEGELPWHINAKELIAMAASTEAFLDVWPQATHVREFTDNTCAEWSAHSGTPRSEKMQEVMARRVAELVLRKVHTQVARVATTENVWADLLSRPGGEAQFLAQAARLKITVRRVAAAGWWRALTKEATSDGEESAPWPTEGEGRDGKGEGAGRVRNRRSAVSEPRWRDDNQGEPAAGTAAARGEGRAARQSAELH